MFRQNKYLRLIGRFAVTSISAKEWRICFERFSELLLSGVVVIFSYMLGKTRRIYFPNTSSAVKKVIALL